VGLLFIFTVYHMPRKVILRVLTVTGTIALSALLCVNTITIYQKNDEISARQTNWQSVFYGLLMISDDPARDMAELGIPSEMMADIGKHAYYADEDYVYPPASEEAQAAFHDHVGIFDILKYYLRHPTKLLHMLNHAAQESIQLHDGFMMYTGQVYSEEHDAVNRFGFWQTIRPLFAGRTFWHYVLVFGVLIVLCVRRIRNKTCAPAMKLLTVTYLAIMLIGILQYPLSVLGNGFADNNKQLFAFMLCYDFILIATAFEGGRALHTAYLRYLAARKGGVSVGKEEPA
jgi:hypothetical protein